MAVDFKQVLSVAKKNGVSIGAAVVALVAVAVPFFYADGVIAEVKTALSARKGVAESVKSVANKPRNLPLLDPDATEPRPLGAFPNEAVIKKGTAALESFKTQANALLETAVKLNAHTPLVPRVFTQPELFQRYAYEFRDRYFQVMPEGLVQRVNGGVPYTQEQIAQAVANRKEQINQTMPLRQAGGIINQAEVNAALARAEVEIPLQMRNDVATKHPVYVTRETWSPAPPQTMPVTGNAPRPEAVWFAQLGLWIQEDVCDIVNAANKGSTSVLTSPVKHLVRIGIANTTPTGPYVLAKAGAEGAPGGGVALTKANPAAAITFDRTFTLTGRVTSPVYDVVHYQMLVRVSESKVAEFLAEIPRNRLHYVLKVDARAVDSALEASTFGFLYGTEPVVELSIECEALYLRKWTEPLMPKYVKQLIGAEEPSANAAPGGGVGF